MIRIWWPSPLYEAKPYGAMVLGLLVGALSLARSWSLGAWEPSFAVAFVVACSILVYGGVILQMRLEYRRRSRWQRERRR